MLNNPSLSSSLEDYLEAVYIVSRQEGAAHANKIAEYLGVGKSSVSWALGQLAQQGLADYQPYKPIVLTPAGVDRARQVVQRHEQIKRFLTEVLAVDDSTAEANACRMEHVVGSGIMNRMKQFMTFMEMCPRGGSEWLDGFRYFCEHGRRREDCPQKLADRPAGLDEKGSLAPDEPEPVVALPKVSKDRDRQLIERFVEVLGAGGMELSSGERVVMEVFMGVERHQSLDQIYQAARSRDDRVELAMAVRVMRLLCEYKLAREIRFRHQVLYEHYHPESHHDHCYCVKCGSIIEFFDPRLEAAQNENARKAEFRVLTHSLELFGVCSDCVKREAKVRSLSECMAGEMVRVQQITADAATTRRITDMGLAPGTVVEVLSDRCTGRSVIVMAGPMRLMLDCDMASKVRVSLLESQLRQQTMGHGRRQRHRHAAEGRRFTEP